MISQLPAILCKETGFLGAVAPKTGFLGAVAPKTGFLGAVAPKTGLGVSPNLSFSRIIPKAEEPKRRGIEKLRKDDQPMRRIQAWAYLAVVLALFWLVLAFMLIVFSDFPFIVISMGLTTLAILSALVCALAWAWTHEY